MLVFEDLHNWGSSAQKSERETFAFIGTAKSITFPDRQQCRHRVEKGELSDGGAGYTCETYQPAILSVSDILPQNSGDNPHSRLK